ncbi:Prefoldin subunit 4 [Cristinia sonorae]|uniref:Prefoldin subunit 4 n=1 Tax=Cristinia sonorae TaxID=1940300 RepID=A0A8K0XUI6_9AGAR|nr:Prefoldin subunit 4 [Cristinia sonorae]
MRMLAQEDENDDGAEVNWEDQQRINSFSKLNARLKALEERITGLKQEKEALDDLSTELELADEDQLVMYRVGEAFLHIPHPRALKRLERDQAELDKDLATLVASSEDIEKEMKELKVTLYSKFGRAINLDE